MAFFVLTLEMQTGHQLLPLAVMIAQNEFSLLEFEWKGAGLDLPKLEQTAIGDSAQFCGGLTYRNACQRLAAMMRK